MLNGQIRPHRGMARRPWVEIEDGKALLPYDLALHLLIGQKADSKCFRDNYAKCDKPDNYAKWYTRQPEN